MKIKRKWFYIIAVIFFLYIGLAARLILASIVHRSDVDGFVIDAKIFEEGKNIYLYQKYYNYSPIFFYILGLLGKLQQLIGLFPLRIIILWFLSFFDIITCLILIGLAGQRKINPLPVVVLFFLSPVSMIVTGYHGQFDNIAIMFLLLGIYLYGMKMKISRNIKTFLLWLILTIGLTMKHTIILPVIAFWLHFSKKISIAAFILLGSLFFFVLTFIPFLPHAKDQIIENVIKYKSMENLYGVSYLLSKVCTQCAGGYIGLIARNVFLLLSLAFVIFIRSRDVARTCLVSFLFFLTFTTGIGGQYFIFPIALGALFPSIWFYLYSTVVTLFFLGNYWEFNIGAFKIFSWNVVWVFTFLWFLSELKVHLFPRGDVTLHLKNNTLSSPSTSTKVFPG